MRALSLGAKDFPNKPFGTREVVLRIRNLLEIRLLQRELWSEKQALTPRTRDPAPTRTLDQRPT